MEIRFAKRTWIYLLCHIGTLWYESSRDMDVCTLSWMGSVELSICKLLTKHISKSSDTEISACNYSAIKNDNSAVKSAC